MMPVTQIKMRTVALPKVTCARGTSGRKMVAMAPQGLGRDMAACSLAVLLGVASVGTVVEPAQALNPVSDVAQLPLGTGTQPRIIEGEGDGLGAYVEEDVEGPLKPPGKDVVEKAKKGADEVKNVVSAQGSKPFTTGVERAKEGAVRGGEEGKNFLEEVTKKVEDTKSNIFGQ